jgi:predicted nuclease of predicted toxin-antitoxin system
MAILLDEMYTGLGPYLKALGWDVITVEEAGLKGAGDLEVVEHAKREGFLLVTQDPRVADLARLKGVSCVVVGLVEVARVIDQKLKAKEREISSGPKPGA